MSGASVAGSQVQPGDVIWSPPDDWRTTTRIGAFVRFVEERDGVRFDDWDDLWQWSVRDLDGFWSAVWDHFGVASDTGYDTVLAHEAMPGARWFEGARLNYARHLLADTSRDDEVAVVAYSQTRERVELTFGELRAQVARARAGLAGLGVGPGDRVAAYLPNIPETLVAFLATASLGAVWASCAPEFGARSVVDRFAQVEPKVLLVVAGYRFGAKDVDRTAEVAEICRALPTVEHVVQVPYGGEALAHTLSWPDLLATDEPLTFEAVAFDHPLYVLFSSGTTGKPKPIVHGHGGILLEHLKNHALSWDLGPGDRLLWFSTTAWMMWNALVSALLVRASIVMIDGNPMFPDLDWQWRLAEETGATLMGASPGFLMASRKEGLRPAVDHDLSRVRQIGAAGSPLPIEGYAWVREQFGPDVLLNVGSGGTDVCTGIVQGSPLQPVRAGEISGACLGVAAAAYDPQGRPVVGELGELVITRPMPSMPVGFWGDADGSRYRSTYFEDFAGVWRHGDWVRFDEHGSCVVAGRSDATLNRGGVRLGTAEFYRVVEEMPEVEDSLVVHLEDPAGGNGELILFVVPATGAELDDELRTSIARELRSALSPRHVPDAVVAVPAVPRTRTGKKLELPAKRILQGRPVAEVATADSLADPQALDAYVAYAAARDGQGQS
ncbi:acetoacetate--CoA ligase [Nocardioides pocheonensis]|uniref:acetoacetate--CoA ligase n=1 Tax=Nocardioides pocheonensis TaxID=661485 RepID=UPI001FE68B8F|nr:acetoacetate--CoA ligase [Nocardioides pocheonensis]